MTQVLLIDNGSLEPAATLNLRKLASGLSTKIDQTVHPVSLQHSNKIAVELLNHQAANTLRPFIASQLESGERKFLLIPLFFGPSKALSSYVPDTMTQLENEYGTFQWVLANTLSSNTVAEPVLVDILFNNIQSELAIDTGSVVLVDHGSPLPEVTQVKSLLADKLKSKLSATLYEAVMERRRGKEYDFNGKLLEEVLDEIAATEPRARVVVSLLFVSPGRHAGDKGDIVRICKQAQTKHRNMHVTLTPLVGDHPALLDLLHQRYLSLTEGAPNA